MCRSLQKKASKCQVLHCSCLTSFIDLTSARLLNISAPTCLCLHALLPHSRKVCTNPHKTSHCELHTVTSTENSTGLLLCNDQKK